MRKRERGRLGGKERGWKGEREREREGRREWRETKKRTIWKEQKLAEGKGGERKEK